MIKNYSFICSSLDIISSHVNFRYQKVILNFRYSMWNDLGENGFFTIMYIEG